MNTYIEWKSNFSTSWSRRLVIEVPVTRHDGPDSQSFFPMFRALLLLLPVHPWATAALLSSPRAAAILLSSPSAILRHRRTADPCARYVQGASDLDEDAAALLAECNGDVEKARTSYIG